MQQRSTMNSWKKLAKYAQMIGIKEKARKNYFASSENISLDYSGQNINPGILDSLFELAKECQLQAQIHRLMSGQAVNHTENRPALHTALRALDDECILVKGVNVVPEVVKARKAMGLIATTIRNGEWLGYSGKAIRDVVNIGIGGSMLGPLFCIQALSDLASENLGFHFISDMDPYAFSRITAKLNPETTLFIISSKSLTTAETLSHLQQALAWTKQPQAFDKHFIAVTANVKKAQEIGFKTILPLWDWIGGRYSFCSAINLIACIAIGFEAFQAILSGAQMMDKHFRNTDFTENLPVLLALLGIWNINFLNMNNLLVLGYAQALESFVPYLQQLDMESNGKSINTQGQRIDYATAPIIWGGLGNQAQHSYYQLLCQGKHKITADLISIQSFNKKFINHMCQVHKEILTKGVQDESNPHYCIPGQIPINHLSLADCSPQTIGSLIALYEHKIFVQGIIWNINSFDQPGVESSKKIIRQNLISAL